MDSLITGYNCQLEPDHHDIGSGRYGLVIILPCDISAAMPYLNAVLDDPWYDHENHVLIGVSGKTRYAFRPQEIRVAGAANADNMARLAGEAVALVNRVWGERDGITPRLSESKLPAAYEIYKLLPRDNCRRCGYLTCLAFAAEMRAGTVTLDDCPPLAEPDNAGMRQMIAALFQDD